MKQEHQKRKNADFYADIKVRIDTQGKGLLKTQRQAARGA